MEGLLIRVPCADRYAIVLDQLGDPDFRRSRDCHDRLLCDESLSLRTIAAMAGAGVDVDILAERLLRRGAGAFSADRAALLAAIQEKAGKTEIGRNPLGQDLLRGMMCTEFVVRTTSTALAPER